MAGSLTPPDKHSSDLVGLPSPSGLDMTAITSTVQAPPSPLPTPSPPVVTALSSGGRQPMEVDASSGGALYNSSGVLGYVVVVK